MTPQETLDHLRSLTDPTPEQLREASDLALLARGWRWEDAPHTDPARQYFVSPDGAKYSAAAAMRPHPCASIDDAVRWMVPEGLILETDYDNRKGHTSRRPTYVNMWEPRPYGKNWHHRGHVEPALALTIACLSATLGGEK